jgi:hypothetical protein
VFDHAGIPIRTCGKHCCVCVGFPVEESKSQFDSGADLERSCVDLGPRVGVVGFPKSSQVLFVMIFTYVSSSIT